MLRDISLRYKKPIALGIKSDLYYLKRSCEMKIYFKSSVVLIMILVLFSISAVFASGNSILILTHPNQQSVASDKSSYGMNYYESLQSISKNIVSITNNSNYPIKLWCKKTNNTIRFE